MIDVPLREGNLHIVDEVIAMITESVVLGTEGVASMVSGFRDGVIRVVYKNPAHGVKVAAQGNKVILEVKVSVRYGAHIGNTAAIIQENVKNEVETLTGVNVEAVRVVVEQIALPQDQKRVKKNA